MTDDIKSWSREELESAYVQREVQLKKATEGIKEQQHRDLEAKYKVLVEASTRLCNEAAVLCYGLGAFATAIEFTKGEIEKTREAIKSTANPNPPLPTQD